MILTKLARGSTSAFRKVQSLRATVDRPTTRTIVSWAEQDHWEDPSGPLGIDRPSPKLAPLSPESPPWLHNLHRNGVGDTFDRDAIL